MKNNNEIKHLKSIKKILLQSEEKHITMISEKLTEEELLNPNEETIMNLDSIINKNKIERLDLNL